MDIYDWSVNRTIAMLLIIPNALIQGIEDYNGDMDFKMAGTNKGITALQVSALIILIHLTHNLSENIS